MSIKLALLKSGETIISNVKELISEEKVFGYIFEKPLKININQQLFLAESSSSTNDNSIDVTLSSWIVLTLDKEITIPYDWVVTIVEPIKTIRNLYEERLNEKTGEVSSLES